MRNARAGSEHTWAAFLLSVIPRQRSLSLLRVGRYYTFSLLAVADGGR